MLFVIYTFFHNILYLFRTKHSFGNKLRILVKYVQISITLVFAKSLKLKQIRFGSFRIYGFDYYTLQHLFGAIFVRNEYYFSTTAKAPQILDCGSNIGMSVLFFKYLYPNCSIQAFEPDLQTFNMLKKNVETNNLTNITLHNEAISDKDGTAVFYRDDQPGTLQMGLTKRGVAPKKSIETQTISLANYLKDKKFAFMKMDIEGYETVVLPDLYNKNVLSNIEELVLEYHHNLKDMHSNLAEILQCLDNLKYSYQLDTACIPPSTKNKFQDVLIFAYKSDRKLA
jgi:FkbM family methyltransferase